MKNVSLENFVEERINENRTLFTIEEIEFIENHRKCVDKVYLLGATNARDCYKNNNFSD